MRALTAFVALAIAASSCAPTQTSSSPSPALSTAAAVTTAPATSRVPEGLAETPIAIVTSPMRRWFTTPDGAFREEPTAAIVFPGIDAAPGLPRARLRSTQRTVDLTFTPATPGPAGPGRPSWTGIVPLDAAAPGPQTVEFLVRLRDGSDTVVGSRELLLSRPEYVVWTLDFEGDAASNATLDNTWAIAQAHTVPMTIMWNPRVWTTTQVSTDRADQMQQWTESIAHVGMAEIALHLHAWTDFVAAAGVTPRTAPNWAGRSDGYDVPLTAFDESETRKLVDHALKLMAEHGMTKPTSFRGGGLFANAANLRAVAAAGFTADTSGTPAGVFGRLPLPWKLADDAQPYYPSREDANASGDLPLLEAPNIAGNTFGYDSRTIQPLIRADLAMLAAPGEIAKERRALTLVSHPGTIDGVERTAIEALFRAFEPLRYERDAGPLRFVTLAQLANAYSR